MSRIAIYTRYSSNNQKDTSIEDQYRNCERYVKRDENWHIVEHYSDKAISGSRGDRPEYQKMLKDARNEAFDVLLVDDLSRLSRDEIETKQTIQNFKYHDLRIIGVSDGFDTNDKSYKIQASARGMVNELFLDDLREKTHRGLEGVALKGFSCGGNIYGYDSVPIKDPTKKDQYGRPLIIAVKREINNTEARWVKQIYQWYANGYSPRWIAGELNRLKIPSPRNKKWAFSAITPNLKKHTGLLANQIYIGRYIWNKSRWVKEPITKKRRRKMRPQKEWIITEMPELSILPKKLWDEVQDRIQKTHDKSAKLRASLSLHGGQGRGPKYLFSSLLKCSCCGSNFVIVQQGKYGCRLHKDGGGSVACSNSLKISRKSIEKQLIDAIRTELFTEEHVLLFRKQIKKAFSEKLKTTTENNITNKKRLVDVDNQIGNIIEAVKKGITHSTMQKELEILHTEKNNLENELNIEPFVIKQLDDELPRALEHFKEVMLDIERLINVHVNKARDSLEKIIGGKISLAPSNDNSHLIARMRGKYNGLLNMHKRYKKQRQNNGGCGGRI